MHGRRDPHRHPLRALARGGSGWRSGVWGRDGGELRGCGRGDVRGEGAGRHSGIVHDRRWLVHPHGGSPLVFPGDLLDGYDVPVIEKRSHFDSWREAITSGKPACASFDFSSPLTETVLLGNIAVRFPNEKLTWDTGKLKFTNHEKANTFIRSQYRKGWQLAGLS